MPNRPVWLIKFRPGARQRAHFSIFIPFPQYSNENPNNKNMPCRGTIIHVVGTPVAMALQFKSNIACNTTRSFESAVLLGHVDDSLIVDQIPSSSRPNEVVERDNPIGRIEKEALHIRPPRGGNVLAPVNDETNRRCQEWTMDFIRHLVRKGIINSAAIDIAQAQRDPPDFGIGLRPVPQQQQPVSARQQPTQPQRPEQRPQAGSSRVSSTQAQAAGWVWDDQYKRYKRWDGAKWVWAS